MKNNVRQLMVLLLIPMLFSCATVTVNVYFPDKDVEAAYEDIESGLDFDVIPSRKDTAAVKPKAKSRSEAVFPEFAPLFWIQAAWADAKLQQTINAQLKKMDDVQNSLARRKERLDTLARLFDAGLVGMKKDGTISRLPAGLVESPSETPESVFGKEGGDTEFSAFIRDENEDRKILIRGMAVATLRATEQDEEDKDALENGMAKSRSLFSKSQTGKLKPGWFYQDEDANWVKVESEEEPPAKKP